MTDPSETATKAVRCLVSGRVQGVGYRAATVRRATALGLQGVARNLADGRVEVTTRGEASAVAELVGWLWQGPALARVTGVEIEDLDARTLSLPDGGFATA